MIERLGPEILSGPAPYAWRRPIGLPYGGPERARQDADPPLIDDGPWGGVPLGGLGAGSIGRTHRGDFMNLYKEGWSYNNMGYASALAWLMMLVVVVAALVLFRTSARWVFYAGGDR